MDVHEAMLEMGEQADPIREALRRMLAEFGDQHYHTCPADNDSGPCNCFAGHLVVKALAALGMKQEQFNKARRNEMRLFVLDENGNVVFEFNADSSSYHLNYSKEMQAKVIKVINEALQVLERRS